MIHNRSTEVTWQVYIDWMMECLHFLSNKRAVASHVFREGNGVVDAMANHGRTIESFEWWPSYPSFYGSLIYDDLNRVERG